MINRPFKYTSAIIKSIILKNDKLFAFFYIEYKIY